MTGVKRYIVFMLFLLLTLAHADPALDAAKQAAFVQTGAAALQAKAAAWGKGELARRGLLGPLEIVLAARHVVVNREVELTLSPSLSCRLTPSAIYATWRW